MNFSILSAITFLSAFLLFQIELIMAKLLLPTYGGSYLVWGACIVFFQAVLLGGYVFAHQLISRHSFKFYRNVHLAVLLLPFLFFPGRSIDLSAAQSSLPMVIDIFIKLTLSIGPVFFALSTISLVTQSWLSQSTLKERSNPYTLYAISNLGSFAGLLSYPFVFELFLTKTEQLNIWRFCYLAFVLLNVLALMRIPVEQRITAASKDQRTSWPQAFQWLCLSAGGVVLFLSVTNIMTYEIAPVPLLWIIPLTIYLFSFVLNFKNRPFNPGWINRFIFTIASVSIVYYFVSKMLSVPTSLSTVVFSLLLFILCMFIQGRLIATKPAPEGLTFFYVMISLGGFLGGILTSWVIPLISINLVEFLVGILLLAIGAKHRWLILITITAIVFSSPIETAIKNHPSLAKKRNYYGIYDVFEDKGVRIMLHGTTLHGIQLTEPSKQWIPLGYYSPTSPLGDILIKNVFNTTRIAGIGLGAGTIAMYSRADCPVDFYELDPDVLDMAQKHFSYLRLAPGPIETFIGDGRIMLKQQGRKYDIIVVDAFGGDSIPTHLLNNDMITSYHQRLNEGGAIAFHIPNRYFNVKPILAHMAASMGAYAAYKRTPDEGFTMRTVWGMITWDQARYLKLINEHGWQPLKASDYPWVRAWDDDYSSVLPIIKWGQLTDSFKHIGKIK